MAGSDTRSASEEYGLRDSRKGAILRNAAAIAPFALWIGLMAALPETAWAYAVRAAATTVAAMALWRLPQVSGAFNFSRNPRWIPYGLLAGAAVAFVWMAPENGMLPPEAADFYKKWLCGTPGFDPEPTAPGKSPYDPAVCGIALTYIKLFGSAAVIAVAEEIFFRSFLYRWLQGRHFADVPENRFDATAFALTLFLFSAEHDRWLAAAVAGTVYGILYIYGGIGAAITAHATTNLIIGWTAIHSTPFDKWGFW